MWVRRAQRTHKKTSGVPRLRRFSYVNNLIQLFLFYHSYAEYAFNGS